MTDGRASMVDVSQLIEDVAEYESYAFLIGAGTSKRAGILTSGQLIDKWQKEQYESADTDEERDEWVETVEDEVMDEDQSRYGFWFEQEHPKRIHRRDYIQDLVDGAHPMPGHIILAMMLDNGYVPHVLTPNFDDLLFDAFYRYIGERPRVIAHQAIAPEFRLVNDDPTIVKLHGDYLFDNLKNTDPETEALENALEKILRQTVSEYGLVVVGYGGGDESIMEPLKEADLSEYGIYWCARSPDKLNPEVEQLLERPNVDLVEIDGFESLMARFEGKFPGVELPAPDEVVERAENRAQRWGSELRQMVTETDEETATEEEEELQERTEKRWKAIELIDEGKYSQAIELLDEVIDSNPEDAKAYYDRAFAKTRLERYEEAIDDYNQAIELDPEYADVYVNRGVTKGRLERYEEAIDDFDQAIELLPEYTFALMNRSEMHLRFGEFKQAETDAEEANSHSTSTADRAISLLLELIAKLVQGKDIRVKEAKYRSLCEEDFDTTWRVVDLENWLENADLDPEKHEKIEELIDLLREHKDDS